MKRYISLFLAAAMIMRSIIAFAATPQDDIYKEIQTDIRAKYYSDAMSKAQQALQTAGLSPKDKVRWHYDF